MFYLFMIYDDLICCSWLKHWAFFILLCILFWVFNINKIAPRNGADWVIIIIIINAKQGSREIYIIFHTKSWNAQIALQNSYYYYYIYYYHHMRQGRSILIGCKIRLYQHPNPKTAIEFHLRTTWDYSRTHNVCSLLSIYSILK